MEMELSEPYRRKWRRDRRKKKREESKVAVNEF